MPDDRWVSEKEASHYLGVSEQKLRIWREVGYLKPGTHWRIFQELKNSRWASEVIYHLPWCQEEINHWLAKDAPINDVAA